MQFEGFFLLYLLRICSFTVYITNTLRREGQVMEFQFCFQQLTSVNLDKILYLAVLLQVYISSFLMYIHHYITVPNLTLNFYYFRCIYFYILAFFVQCKQYYRRESGVTAQNLPSLVSCLPLLRSMIYFINVLVISYY